LLRWFGTLLALGLLIWLLSSQGWENILTAFRQIDLWRFILALVLTLISRLAVTGRWFALLRGAQVKASFGLVARITFAGLFANNFLPSTIGGDVVRLGGALRMGLNRGVSLASLIVDRLVGMVGMAMALPGLLIVLPAVQMSTSVAVVAGGKDLLQRGWHRLREVLSLWIRNPGSLVGALGFTWIHMLCTFGSVWLILTGMGQQISSVAVGGLWSLVYFITLLPVSVNGMGTQELAISLLYTRLGGVSVESALVLALLMRVLPMLASLPGAFFVPQMIAGEKDKADLDVGNG